MSELLYVPKFRRITESPYLPKFCELPISRKLVKLPKFCKVTESPWFLKSGKITELRTHTHFLISAATIRWANDSKWQKL